MKYILVLNKIHIMAGIDLVLMSDELNQVWCDAVEYNRILDR